MGKTFSRKGKWPNATVPALTARRAKRWRKAYTPGSAEARHATKATYRVVKHIGAAELREILL